MSIRNDNFHGEKFSFLMVVVLLLTIMGCTVRSASTGTAKSAQITELSATNTLTSTIFTISSTPTNIPSSITQTPTFLPTSSTIPTFTLTPYPTVSFAYPVDLSQVPQYDAYDINRTVGQIESDAGSEFNIPIKCNNDGWMRPGTNDDHPGWDFGSGMCGIDVSGMPVNGMSLGNKCEVINVQDQGLWIDCGILNTTTGLYRIGIKYGHITPIVKIGTFVDSQTTVAKLNSQSNELEIQVFCMNPKTTESLSGNELAKYIFDQLSPFDKVGAVGTPPIICDPIKLGLKSKPSFGPQK